MAAVIGAFDRTGEFLACAKSFHQRVISGRVQLTRRGLSSRLKSHSTPRSSEFLSAARVLANDLQLTLTKFHKLMLLFDQAPETIPSQSVTKLIEVIQCDIVDLNKAIATLHDMQRSATSGSSGGSSQLDKHQKLMITAVEYRMSYLVSSFRRLLEEKKSYLTGTPQDSSVHPAAAGSGGNSTETSATNPVITGPLVSGTTTLPSVPHWTNHQHSNFDRTRLSGTGSTNSLSSPPVKPVYSLYPPSPTTITTVQNSTQPVSFYISSPSDSQSAPTQPYVPVSPQQHQQQQQPQVHHLQQQQLQLPILDQEVRQRDAAMRRVESTIVQLGEIYQQFSSLVREQGDLVTRIDSQTEEAELNIGSAHEQLIFYLRSVSARRAFMIKVFAVLLCCFIIFAWIR